jgi:hypothetical protein
MCGRFDTLHRVLPGAAPLHRRAEKKLASMKAFIDAKAQRFIP